MVDLFEDDDLEEAEYWAAREVLEEILGSLPSRFMVLLQLHRLVIADSKDVIVDKGEKADRLLDLYNLLPEEWHSEEFDPDLDQMDRLIESLTPFLDDRSSA